jgi:hypothetical protein
MKLRIEICAIQEVPLAIAFRNKVYSENIHVGTLFLNYFQGNLEEPYFLRIGC